jgi:hypothetical protein
MAGRGRVAAVSIELSEIGARGARGLKPSASDRSGAGASATDHLIGGRRASEQADRSPTRVGSDYGRQMAPAFCRASA